ncbi:hypothetical protein CTAYLR_003075 [Chrysophaeum taylorii]|uniref:Coatomer subunit epsilon n=1 Tax=Chrysophaeum taylorii TaxID=2483200 RepID=A0AAD7XHT2_9STRA|nr:hypothetical protein CTAYLR_003075 [Chrysophaeum taylorii]
MADPDELYTLRNRFWLGNFQLAIAEGNNLTRVSDELRVERDEFVYRSYVGLGQYNLVLNEVKDDAPPSLLAVRLMARYLSAPDDERDDVLETLSEWMRDGKTSANPTVQLAAAIIYEKENKMDQAFTAIRHQSTMEQIALWAQFCIRIYRVDLAAEKLKQLQEMDEDHSLTQLCSAWVHISQGGDKLKEAAYTYEELIDKFEPTIALLNGLAAARMHMHEWEDAEKHLLSALQKGDNPDTLVNLIATYCHLEKEQQVIDRYIHQLETNFPKHPTVEKLNRCKATFDRVAEQMIKQVDTPPED